MIFVADLPPEMQERVVCSIQAANHYHIPANALLAVAEQEGGRPGQWVRNTNGTFDVGVLQFNTAYLKTLQQYGITADHVAQSGCFPYYLAAWRIKRHITMDKTGDFWTKVANYHSYTPQHNAKYRGKIIPRAARWARWIEERKGMKPVQTTQSAPTGRAIKSNVFLDAPPKSNPVAMAVTPPSALPPITDTSNLQPPAGSAFSAVNVGHVKRQGNTVKVVYQHRSTPSERPRYQQAVAKRPTATDARYASSAVYVPNKVRLGVNTASNARLYLP